MPQEVNVLIIEDDKNLALVLDETLKHNGYRTWLADGPKEGLTILTSTPCAVALTELHSSKMSAIQFIQEAHKISAQTSIIVLTLYSFIRSAIEAMEAGAYGYITKPLNTSEIRIVVERAVERYLLLSTGDEKDYFVDLAVRDGLTGLFNRRYFNELIKIEISRLKRAPSSLSLLMLDIDNFKNYNDTQGHPAGDELLKKAAQVFRNCVRAVDIVCRYGGEEFIVMLTQTDKGAAQIIAERLRMQAGLYLPTTISIGVATLPQDAQNVEDLIQKADDALYQAKKSGKNKWCAA